MWSQYCFRLWKCLIWRLWRPVLAFWGLRKSNLLNKVHTSSSSGEFGRDVEEGTGIGSSLGGEIAMLFFLLYNHEINNNMRSIWINFIGNYLPNYSFSDGLEIRVFHRFLRSDSVGVVVDQHFGQNVDGLIRTQTRVVRVDELLPFLFLVPHKRKNTVQESRRNGSRVLDYISSNIYWVHRFREPLRFWRASRSCHLLGRTAPFWRSWKPS